MQTQHNIHFTGDGNVNCTCGSRECVRVLHQSPMMSRIICAASTAVTLESHEKITLALDLDDTLIYAILTQATAATAATAAATTATTATAATPTPIFDKSFVVCGYQYVAVARDNAETALIFLHMMTNLCLYTAASRDYAIAALDAFGWRKYFKHIIARENYPAGPKDLRALPRYSDWAILVDDTASNHVPGQSYVRVDRIVPGRADSTLSYVVLLIATTDRAQHCITGDILKLGDLV